MKESTNPPCIELVDVSKSFGTHSHKTAALRHASLGLFPGELVSLLGPSGSGKTTLLTLMTGLLKPTSGTVVLFGKVLASYTSKELQRLRARRIGFVFQTFNLIDSLTVLENVMVALRFGGKSVFEARRRAARLLEETNVAHLAKKFPATLSQGEKQRVALARAMANQADLIVADEPTASLDTANGRQIVQLLYGHAKKSGKCVVVATHDLRVTHCADRHFLIQDGVLSQSEGVIEPHPSINFSPTHAEIVSQSSRLPLRQPEACSQ